MAASENNDELLQVLSDFNDEASSLLTNESIEVYQFIRERFEASKHNILDDGVFQFAYRSFYRLDNAGLGDDLKRRYFELLQENASNEELDIKKICDELRRIKTIKNKNTMQFSFATKMAATINEKRPIYDSLVAKVFGFSAPYAVKDWDKRYEKYMQFYERISSTVAWLKDQERMLEIMRAYDKKLKNWKSLPEMKKYDFVFWSTGKAIANQA